jgi:hypothetical protein
MEHKICLLRKIFCETLQINTKNRPRKIRTVFPTCIITSKVNIHQTVYQNKHKIRVTKLTTYYDNLVLYAH